jgi:hypothetical protein
MPFEITYDAADDYVLATFTGQIHLPLVREYIAALLPVLEETGCRRLLSDSTQAQIHLSDADIIQLPRMAEASPLTAALKRAALASEGSSGYAMYETLSKMQGQNLRVFSDRNEALQWLLSDQE